MLLIDANIFLELMLGQDRAVESKEFLGRVREGALRAILTDITLDSVLLVME